MQSALVLGLLVLAIVLLAREKLPADIITLLLLVALVGSGVLTTGEAFEGFSSDIIIILGSIFVISGALQETGLLDAIGEWLVRLGQAGSKRLLLLLMGSAASIRHL
jgi:Na+/H+ antiporter NhaD/arsenite permease-like protein